MKIEILGTGCKKCNDLEAVVKLAIAKIGGFHSIKKVDDVIEIMNYGVMSTSISYRWCCEKYRKSSKC